MLLPVGHQSDAAKVTADVKSIGVASEASGIFVSPGYSTPHLLRHDTNVAIRRANSNKIERNIICTGIDENFGREPIILRFSTKIGALDVLAGYKSNASTGVGP